MKFWVGVTLQGWFDFLHAQSGIEEVNFWQPSTHSYFRAIEKGDLFLFKLHRSARTHQRDVIAGGGVFASYSILPISLAWESFEKKNGAASYSELRHQILPFRRIADSLNSDFPIGCIILTQPFFFDESTWFPVPGWSSSIVRGKTYGLEDEAGRYIWENLKRAWEHKRVFNLDKEANQIEEERARYGKETTIKPRLGQGAFRILVTDAYRRSCAITEEHSLPALEAAHIRPYNEDGPHEVSNGLLLRSDFHRLFDRGYITVTPDYRVRISRRLKEEFENGRSYYPFDNHTLNHFPNSPQEKPLREMLLWHNENKFKA
jgi:putative restriction endonuclease